jgi:hypothetical protein
MTDDPPALHNYSNKLYNSGVSRLYHPGPILYKIGRAVVQSGVQYEVQTVDFPENYYLR